MQLRDLAAIPNRHPVTVEFAHQGTPQFLIVSDIPLQLMTPMFQPLQFSDAIRYVLSRHGYRAGRYRIGYHGWHLLRRSEHDRWLWWLPGT